MAKQLGRRTYNKAANNKHVPEGHGDTTRTVRLTLAERRGEPLSYTEKGMVKAVPRAADAVSRPHGLNPSL